MWQIHIQSPTMFSKNEICLHRFSDTLWNESSFFYFFPLLHLPENKKQKICSSLNLPLVTALKAAMPQKKLILYISYWKYSPIVFTTNRCNSHSCILWRCTITFRAYVADSHHQHNVSVLMQRWGSILKLNTCHDVVHVTYTAQIKKQQSKENSEELLFSPA